MARRTQRRESLSLSGVDAGAEQIPTGEAFRPEWIDFEQGIRVGRLEPHERITRILKYQLEQSYRTDFVTDRWGRGVYWQWICWVSRANRKAKTVSSGVNFGCAKFFISPQRELGIFKSGLQVERGHVEGPGEFAGNTLQPDWDWNRLMQQCAAGTALDREIARLLKSEGFLVELGDWSTNKVFSAANFKSARDIRAAARRFSERKWVGFQLYYPMTAEEVCSCTGYELVQAICGVFREVTPAMNECMQVPLTFPEVSLSDLRIRRP